VADAMNDQNANLEIPVEVSLDSVEKRLSEIWEVEGKSALVRACSSNLIAMAKDREEAQAFPVLLAAVAEQYPCRAIIVYHEANPGYDCLSAGPHLHTWISAHCTLPVSGEPQVCSEIITVASCGAAPGDVSNAVASLLVPDLPVFAYWRSFHRDQELLARQLAAFTDVLVVDSHVLKNEPHSRDRLLELLNSPPKGIAVRDINWARLTAWRDLVAQFFDPPAARSWVHRISEIEIGRSVVPGSIPTRTLLLTGWLATRLDWKWISSRRTGDQWFSKWKSRNSEVDVRFLPDESDPDREPGITSLTLKIDGGPRFTIGRQGASYMTASAELHARQVIHSVPQEPADEASLLVRELSLTGEDQIFQHAVAAALELEKSFFQQ
jgi:glucose-6-phosphate dehydrogenase assembly protein OpcA